MKRTRCSNRRAAGDGGQVFGVETLNDRAVPVRRPEGFFRVLEEVSGETGADDAVREGARQSR
jgi:hypothetical protein